MSNRRMMRVGAIATIALASVVTGPAAGAQSAPETVATGLDNPRHLSFDAAGNLYVVEAGRGGAGPCVEHPDLGEFCLGASGAVTKVNDVGADPRVVTGLPSILGPDDALGASDISFTGVRRFVVTIGLGGSDEFRAGFGPGGALLGTLVEGRLDRPGVSLLADVMANEVAANPEPEDIDTNPVGLVRRGGSYLIADAGGNAIVEASHRGTFSTVAVMPPDMALAPPFLGLPPGTQIPTDAVPTSIVRGPDGAYYVSQLTGFPFEKGDADIWRIVRGEEPTIYASGLTNVTDLAFADDGSLYAVQISAEGLLNGPIGSLVKVTPGSSQHETVIGGLFAPYGVALTDSHAYVSTCAVCVGAGEVLKVPLD